MGATGTFEDVIEHDRERTAAQPVDAFLNEWRTFALNRWPEA